MAAENKQLVFDTDFDPQTGSPVEVAAGIVRVTAPNSGPFTFTGTNTFVLGQAELVIVDPGPDDDNHLAALQKFIGGRRVAAIFLTHTHRDHSALAPRLARLAGAPICARGPHRLSRPRHLLEVNPVARSCDWALMPDVIFTDNQTLTYADVPTEVLDTSGHCSNHAAFAIPGTRYVLTGDHIMGWSSTLVSVPDGSMADYFRSLDRMIDIGDRIYLPAHGNVIANGQAHAMALRAHRQERNVKILQAVADGARTTPALTRRIYPHLTGRLALAAQMTITAHVEYLCDADLLHRRFGLIWP